MGCGVGRLSLAGFGMALVAVLAAGCGGSGQASARAASGARVTSSASEAVSGSATAVSRFSAAASPSASAVMFTSAASPVTVVTHASVAAPATHAGAGTPVAAAKKYATPVATFGDLAFGSLTDGTLCMSVPVTVSNTGAGQVYAISVQVSIEQWSSSTGKSTLVVPGGGTRSATYAVCLSGFTQPPGICYEVLEATDYWGDPYPTYEVPIIAHPLGTLCVPR